MLIRHNLVLKKPYIRKKIDHSTLSTVLNSSHQTAYRLYLLTNDIEELQEFARIESEVYSLVAFVKTECAPIGNAKQQIWSIKHLQPILKKKPRYTLRCSLTHNMSNVEVYKCNLVSTDQMEIYSQIQECIEDMNKILSNEKNN